MRKSRPKLRIRVAMYGGAAPGTRMFRPLARALLSNTSRQDLASSKTGRCASGSRRRAEPSESTRAPSALASMSIIKGGRNANNARKWYDWALTPEAQALGARSRAFQVPSNKNTPVPPQAPKLGEIKLIDFDFVKYGSSTERRRLLAKWDNEVRNSPK